MRLCRVVGNVVSTVKHPVYEGQRLMIVLPVDEVGEEAGESFLAVDHVQSGPGDTVLVMREGNGVRQLLEMGKQFPIRSLIVGIVDSIAVDRAASS